MKDNSCPIKILHKCCLSKARLLPNKVKDEKEIESEGIFSCVNPADKDSHGIIVREADVMKTELAVTVESSDEDEDSKIEIAIEGTEKGVKSRNKKARKD